MVNASSLPTMLPPAINNAVLRTGPAVPTEAEGAIPGDFAALLALDLAAAPPQAPADSIAPALPDETATRQPELQSGKILPEALRLSRVVSHYVLVCRLTSGSCSLALRVVLIN